jgi:hypothetical protein
MQYKTIVLELLQEDAGLYDQLRSSNRLLPSMEEYAAELKTIHDQWKEKIRREEPGRDPRQITSEALELAIEELRDRLPCVSPRGGAEPTLEAAMDYLRRHTPPA